jgi:uncharacterized protein YjiS (DUF1127 family)
MYADTPLAPVVPGRRLRDHIVSFATAACARDQVRRDRIRLSQVPDHMLRDIGLTRDDVRHIRRTPPSHL